MAEMLKDKAEEIKKERTMWIKWAITIAVTILFCMLPAGEVYTPEIKKFMAITVFTLLVFIFELMPVIIISVMIPLLFVIFKVGTAQQAFSGWSNDAVLMMLSALVLVGCFKRTNLTKRILFGAMAKLGGSLNALIFGVVVVAIGCVYVGIPFGSILLICMLAFMQDIGVKKGSNMGALLMFVTFLAYNSIGLMLTYDPMFAMFMNFAQKIGATIGIDPSHYNVTFYEYAFHNLIFIPEFFIYVFLAKKIFKPETEYEFSGEYFTKRYKELGEMNTIEKKTFVPIITLFLLYATQGKTGLTVAQCNMIVTAIFFLPGLSIAKFDDLKGIDYGPVFFCAGSLAIGTLANSCGAGKLLADIVAGIVAGDPFVNAGSSYMVAYILNLLLTPMAVCAVMGSSLVQIAFNLGVDPIPMAYAFVQGLNNVLLPHEGAVYLMFFGFGFWKMKQFMKVFTMKAVVTLVYLVVIAVPYWLFLGLYTLPV